MKTPKRTSDSTLLNPKDWPFDPPHYAGDMLARWKRKNRVKQLKHTIAILKQRLLDTEKTLLFTQRFTSCYIVKPNHWPHQDDKGNFISLKEYEKTEREKTINNGSNLD